MGLDVSIARHSSIIYQDTPLSHQRELYNPQSPFHSHSTQGCITYRARRCARCRTYATSSQFLRKASSWRCTRYQAKGSPRQIPSKALRKEPNRHTDHPRYRLLGRCWLCPELLFPSPTPQEQRSLKKGLGILAWKLRIGFPWTGIVISLNSEGVQFLNFA